MALLSLVLLVSCVGGTLSHRLQALRAAWEVEEIGAEQIQGELLKTLPEGDFSLGGYPIFRPPEEKSVLFLQGALDVGAGNTTCQQQLGGLLRALIAACFEKAPGGQVEKALNDMLFPALKPKTCKESVEDIFLHGEDLVGTFRVPREQTLNLKVPEATLPLVQSLDFLTWWLVPLAIAKKDALIWAGFWTDPKDPKGSESRTSRQKLSDFALRTEHDTVHPDTVLGTLVEKHGMLDHCSDTTGKELADNMWKLASFAFVSGMREKGQNTVVALVNKQLEGERSLQKSVLYQYELPTLGLAAWGMGYWSPTVLLIDLKGTCSRTSPALRRQMFGALKPWYIDKKKEYWSACEFSTRARLSWQCMDCPKSSCELDERLARWLKGFQEAKMKQHEKDEELADATCFRREDVVSRLLEGKADLRYQEPFGGNTALHHAAQHGGVSMVELLLMKNADIHARDKFGNTPLHLAIEYFAVGRGIEHVALGRRNYNLAKDMVHLLLKAKADVHARDDEGRTALQLAHKQGDKLDPAVVQLLQKWDEDVPERPPT